MDLSVSYYDKNRADLLISRVTTDTTMLSTFFGSSIPYLPSQIYSFIAAFVILFSYNWRLLAMEAVMLPVVLLVTALSGRIRYTWNNRIQGKISELGGYLAEILANVPLVKIFVKEKVEEQKGREAIEGIYSTKKKSTVILSLVGLLSSMESILQTLVVVVGGAALMKAGHITLEQWMAFYLYAQTLVGSVQSILQYYETIKRAQGSSRRMAELIVEKSEDMGGSKTVPAQPGDLKFENVTFRPGGPQRRRQEHHLRPPGAVL